MVRIGVIGCGGIGRYHIENLKKLPDVQILSVADINLEAARDFAKSQDIPYCVADYEELLKITDIDAVFVCLPTHLHRDAVIAAAQAGKHIFCEKPIAMTLEHAEEMIQTCRGAGVKFMIGFVRRFDNHWGKVRQLVRSGVIGRPVLWRHCTAGPGPKAPWFLDRQQGGGPLIDGAVHNYDFARYTFGEARLVMSSLKTLGKGHTALDTGTGLVQFASGDELMLSWSWGLPKGVTGGSLMDVLGPKGVIFFNAPEDKIPPDVDRTKYGALLLRLEGGQERVELFQKNDMFVDELIYFIDCITSDKEPEITGEDGKKALEIGLAILKSAETGESVRLCSP